MPGPIDVVQAFLAECETSKDALVGAYRRYFTPDTVWENVGMASTTGPDEALGIMGSFEENLGVVTMRVDMLAIAAQGNKVLTERIDHLHKADGSLAMSVRVCGIFEVEGDKITAWRDYFDTAAMMGGGPGA